ncbi:MAG TPA: nicotinamide-nucleotide adenylyltransferase [Candidatus Nanoarchaeia archaeon]|nr:nicotinamide-nucleotide adenylyltransferase [Candidatus Nanoarchaeia archaeon]
MITIVFRTLREISCQLCGSAAIGNKKAKYLCKTCFVYFEDTMNGLLIGRFQPFHKGHLEAVRKAAAKVDKLIIVIGSAQHSNTIDNPFSAEERKKMIEAALYEAHITNTIIIPINDILLDEEYADHVRSQVPHFKKVFAGTNALVAKLFSDAGFEIETTAQEDRFKDIDATEVRRRMLKNEDWRSLVPKSAVQIIEEFEGSQRIKRLFFH